MSAYRHIVIVFGIFLAIAGGESVAMAAASAQPMATSIDAQCLAQAYGDNEAARALFADPLVLESMAQPYPLEPHRPLLYEGQHPGRVRSYALLNALYGPTKAAVRLRLQSVTLLGHRVYLSPAAAQAFHRVSNRLDFLLQQQPHLKSYIFPVGGFAWRNIAGEDRLSPHSFGIAVDINPAKGHYWRWTAPQKRATEGPAVRAAYPHEIVAAFEAEGFIWGGKWYEYDLMHFEYRPEIICKARILREEKIVEE